MMGTMSTATSSPAATMQIGPTAIVDTFAEAFRMRCVRPIITAVDDYWLDAALREVAGYSSSVIGCDAEIGVDRLLGPNDTPDGRPGAALLAFGFSSDALAKAIPNRIGQCVMTCPTTAVYNGMPAEGENAAEESIPLGKHLRYFGDGFQRSKLLGGRRYWRVPVMDGEFVIEEKLGVGKGVAGGNIILQGTTPEIALSAARNASEAIAKLDGVITPLSWRCGSQWQQSRLDLQGHESFDQRCLLPHATRASRERAGRRR